MMAILLVAFHAMFIMVCLTPVMNDIEKWAEAKEMRRLESLDEQDVPA